MEESLNHKRAWWPLGILVVLAWHLLARPALAQETGAGASDVLLWATALAWLVPIGLGMLACGTVPPERVPAVMRVGWLALGLSVVGYWSCGFAFQFGGLGFASDHPGLAGLAREWTLGGLDPAWGSQWGIVGLEGYLLDGGAGSPAALRLFWAQLPWITTSVAVFMWALQGRVWPVQSAVRRPSTSGLGLLLVLAGLLQAALYTLIGNWVWGGGWLSHLGPNLGLGHGFVDFGGSVVHLLGATSALAALVALPARAPVRRPDVWQPALPTLNEQSLSGADVRWTVRDEPYVPMPALHLPVLATAGAWLALLGWIGWFGSTPLDAIDGPALPWPQRMVGLLLAAAGGALSALFAGWLTTGEGNALMTARGVMGALVAVSAGLPFFPLWAALAVGAGVGLLVPLVQYAVDHWLRLEDATSVLGVHGMSALCGLLAVGFLANGQVGEGWNRVGESIYLGVEGQGVSGYLTASGLSSDWPGQFQAQAFGSAAIAFVALLSSGILMGLARGIVRAWHGEGAPRRAVRSARRASRPRFSVSLPAWLRRRKSAPVQESPQTEPANLPEKMLPDEGSELFDGGAEGLDDGSEPSDLLAEEPGEDEAQAAIDESPDESEQPA